MRNRFSIKKNIVSIVSFLIMLLIFTIIIILTIIYLPKINDFYSDTKSTMDAAVKTREFILGFGPVNFLIYIGIQIVQVIIAAIPGMAIQYAGGITYGAFLGTVLSLIGIGIGTLIAFYITRIFGQRALDLFVKKEQQEKFGYLINKKQIKFTVFILFLIPGLPKDIFTYILGFSKINALTFFLISMFGRLPGIVGSCIIGSTLATGNYIATISIFAVSFIIFSLCILYRNKTLGFIHNRFNYRKH